MKITVLYKAAPPESGTEQEADEQRIMAELGNKRMDCVSQPVPFFYATQLLYYIYEELYAIHRTVEETYHTFKMDHRFWQCDDFLQYVNPNTNEVLFYMHFVHGDGDCTYFTVLED